MMVWVYLIASAITAGALPGLGAAWAAEWNPRRLFVAGWVWSGLSLLPIGLYCTRTVRNYLPYVSHQSLGRLTLVLIVVGLLMLPTFVSEGEGSGRRRIAVLVAAGTASAGLLFAVLIFGFQCGRWGA